uniref:GNAT family N-acetyltransferase n=1 Tax=Schlesneria paludicola TaxID=360056 RepID=A0A7C4QPF6_9PLAN
MTAAVAASYEVHTASPRDGLRECVSLLNATRDHESTEERFRWLYLTNPDGEAVVWLLRRNDTGEAVGFTAALPRRMFVAGAVRRCWIGADFSILPAYRTLGLALKLRRAARDGIDRGEADFLYSHPNERMAVIHTHVGHRPIGTMIRLAKPLSLRPFVAEWTSSPSVARLAGALCDPWRAWVDSAAHKDSAFTVRPLQLAELDERFDRLFWDAAPAHDGILGVRDAAYLKWRYADNPLYKTHMLVAEEGRRVAGFVAYVLDGCEAHLKDVFPMNRPDVARTLLGALARLGYQQCWRSLSMILLESNPLRNVCELSGFKLRAEKSQMFGYCSPAQPWSHLVYDQHAWWLTVGDRDV